jgi:hypothetical protein
MTDFPEMAPHPTGYQAGEIKGLIAGPLQVEPGELLAYLIIGITEGGTTVSSDQPTEVGRIGILAQYLQNAVFGYEELVPAMRRRIIELEARVNELEGGSGQA